MTFDEAAAIPQAAVIALQGIRDTGLVQPGRKVLINGAGGGAGSFAVQFAKALGADVTGVCSTRNVDMVRSLGADHVVDYTRADFTRSQRRYDLVLDIAASRAWAAYKRVLKPTAICVIVGGPKTNRWIGPLSHVVKVRLAALRASQKVIFFVAQLNQADLVVLQALLEAGKVTPVIDRCYPLRDVPQAIRYVEQGHARGKVVITVEHTSKT